MGDTRGMQRITAARAVAFAAAGLVLAGAGDRAAARPKPHLALLETEPPTVRGTAFHAGERVRVVLRRSVGGPHETEAVAGRSGAFVATFDRMRLNRCAAFSIVAVGSRGSRATMLRTARRGGCGPGARGPAGG
jgi:hypothetical protein